MASRQSWSTCLVVALDFCSLVAVHEQKREKRNATARLVCCRCRCLRGCVRSAAVSLEAALCGHFERLKLLAVGRGCSFVVSSGPYVSCVGSRATV